MTLANYLVTLPYPFLFWVVPFAPFLFGSLAALSTACLIAGIVLGIKSRERGLLLFGLLALTTHIYFASSLFAVRTEVAHLENWSASLAVFLALQAVLAGTLVYRLKDARLAASLLAVFTTTYALSSVLFMAFSMNLGMPILHPFADLVSVSTSPTSLSLAIAAGVSLLLGTTLGFRARKPALLLFALLALATDIFCAVWYYAASAMLLSAEIAYYGPQVFFGLQLIAGGYLIYRIKGARLAASLLAVFTTIYALSSVFLVLVVLAFSQYGHTHHRPPLAEPHAPPPPASDAR